MNDELPPLPEPFMELHREIIPQVYAAWEKQMRAYAAAAVAAERERCARIVEGVNGWTGTREVAAEIRGI